MQLQLFGESVAVAKQKFIETLDRGDECDCPVCGRFAKVWRRKIHASIAAWLIALYKAGGDNKYVHINDTILHLPVSFQGKFRSTSDYSIVKYWGLAFQETANPEDDKRTSGNWRLTPEGINFVLCNRTIQKYAYVFDDQVLKLDGGELTIRDCLGNSFSYNELWD